LRDPRQPWKVAFPLPEILLVVLCGTLNDVMNALDARIFSECFTSWMDRLRASAPDIVAIDGKTYRRARRGGAHPLTGALELFFGDAAPQAPERRPLTLVARVGAWDEP
jgi:hypothetical protein